MASSSPRRLLRDDILDHLQKRSDHASTIRSMMDSLGHSHGAFYAALRTMTDAGLVTAIGNRPTTYRLTTDGISATRSSTTTTPATPPPTPHRGPVLRPNGTPYQPRRLEGHSDVSVLQTLRSANIPAMLYGPPGTGKTSLVEAAFGRDLITVAGDGDTAVADLVGEYTQTDDGKYVFVHGPLVVAMRTGGVLFLDDATLISPKVLAVVYPAMDGRRRISIKANSGEAVVAADGFYVIAGHNPGVHGAVLTDALSSRFSVQIQVDTDYDLATGLGIDARAVRAARNLAAKQQSDEIGWAPQLRELLAFDRIAAILGVSAAAANLLGVAPAEDRDVIAQVLSSTFGQQINTPLRLGRQL